MGNFFYIKKGISGSLEKGEFVDLLIESGASPWDQAHDISTSSKDQAYVEPGVEQNNPQVEMISGVTPKSFTESNLDDDVYDPNWPYPKTDTAPPAQDKKIWHLDDRFAQLRSAWTNVDASTNIIKIAHFDTGYDSSHKTFPAQNMDLDNEYNFVENIKSAEDTGSEGWLKNPGHGTGTLSILAGNMMKIPQYNGFNDFLGIHHHIKIVPFRVSRSVILWKNKAFVDAMEAVIAAYDDVKTRIHIVTMSMGGLPSKAWADVVNRAYEKGIFIVTAAGNNINRMSPSSLVYPSRFQRVTAACGVTYDGSPYYKMFGIGNLTTMEGNFGPRKVMGKAIAAYTPNVSWAVYHKQDIVSLNGAGTSSATPQIAAAAALYYQKYFSELEAMEFGWQRVETIRQAMYDSALKKIKIGYQNDVELYFGNGALQANEMLKIKPSAVNIQMQEPDVVRWPFLKLITGAGFLEDNGMDDAALEMFEVEVLQIIAQSSALQRLLENEEKEYNDLSVKEQQLFWGIIVELPYTSQALKKMIVNNGLLKIAQTRN